MDSSETLVCPFCGFKDKSDYQILLHIEIHHCEDGNSPFAVGDTSAPSSSSKDVAGTPLSTQLVYPSTSSSPCEPNYIDCPYKCGERVLLAEIQFHTDFHLAEDMSTEDSGSVSAAELSTAPSDGDHALKIMSDNTFSTTISKSLRNHGQLASAFTPSIEKQPTPSLKELFFGSSTKKRVTSHASSSKSGKIRRLGTTELGPYAHEKRMPAWLQRMLEEGAKVTTSNKIGPDGLLVRVEGIANETPDLIPTMARLSLADRTVARAFYCSPEVRHVAKMPKEGGFCGYRNIQMLISYITDSKAPGYRKFGTKLPSIIKLQDLIEEAWDKGYNSSGRIETGGIKLTRKYIGTPEAQALFLSLGIPCEAIAYSSRAELDAYTTLMAAVFTYFEDDEIRGDSHRVFVTTKPPIYFQHQGHSMTIVGVEVHTNGAANLMVFDPMFSPSPSITGTVKYSDPAKLLKAHRRGESYLTKYKDFELLKIPRYED